MDIKYCQTCKKAIPYDPRGGLKTYSNRKYCSRKCTHAGIPRPKAVAHPERLKPCDVCGTIIPKEPNRNWNEYAKKRFCSRKCNAISQSNKVTVQCNNCGKEFKRSPSHIREKMYCSQKCRQKRKQCTCDNCGKIFIVRPSEKNFERVYCGKQCADIGLQVTKLVLNCDFCNAEFERYPSDRKKAKKNGYRFAFCSHACRAAMIASQFVPPRPYQGKHTAKPRNGTKTGKWRKAIKERDSFACQDCGATDKMLAVHHIKPFALYPELAYEISNSVTLCYPCHEFRHSAQIISE